MKKSIDIHGISTTATYKDGDLLKCVNLRKKNGVHKPVTPRKTLRTTTEQYVYTFQHNLPQTGENLIGVRNNNIYLVGTSTETLLTSTTGFKSITQIGNLLQVLDETGIKVLWWVDTEYKLIESNFSGGQTAIELLPVKVDLKVDAEKSNDKALIHIFKTETNFGSNFTGNDDTDGQSTEEIKLRTDSANGLIEKVKSIEAENGKLTGLVQACTAIELYDGSYVLHSNPVLLGIAADKFTRYENFIVNGTTHDYINNRPVFYPKSEADTVNYPGSSYPAALPYYQFDNDNKFNTECEPLAYKSAQNVASEFAPTFTAWWNKITLISQAGQLPVESPVYVLSNRNLLKYKVSQNIDSKYTSLIKSLSIFITKEIHIENMEKNFGYTYNNKREHTISKAVGSSVGVSYLTENYFPTYKTNAEILKELADNQQFYKVHEIPFDDIKTTTDNGGWVTIELKGKLGENLTMQEELPVDNFTHHNLLPNAQIVYNSKLHAMDYKQELFHGWPYEYFEQKETGTGQFPTQTRDVTVGGYPHWWAEVKIKTENGTTTVVMHKATQYGTWERNTYANTPMLSYPDSRAYEITLYIARFTLNGTSGFNKSTYKLTPSTTHNFAYYISSDLKPITYSITGTPSNVNPPETNRTLIYRNSMKVSSVNNPFYFPSDTTFTIGTGILLNAGTNAQRMSEGQFGQYDLYVLTTEGLYSLDTGTTIAYNRQSPASLEIPTSAIICATPFGVVFVGKRGLYIINGQQTELISAQIEETSQANSIYGASLSFLTYLKTLKDILYDPNQNELIVVSTAHDYNWVLNIDSKMWYMSTEKIDFEVKNSSPNLLVVAGKTIKDYSQVQTNKAAVALITRPIYFGIDEVKQLQRGILRGRVYQMNTLANSNDLFYSVFGSNDGTNHTILRGFRMLNTKQDRDYKDFDSGMIARSTYRNYSVAFEATVDERSEISHIDFEVADNYKNDKMR